MPPTKVIRRIDAEIAELLPAYLESLRSGLNEARPWLRDGDFTRLARLGHGWKGTGGSYGLSEVSDWGAALERASQRAEASLIGPILDALAGFLERIEIRFD